MSRKQKNQKTKIFNHAAICGLLFSIVLIYYSGLFDVIKFGFNRENKNYLFYLIMNSGGWGIIGWGMLSFFMLFSIVASLNYKLRANPDLYFGLASLNPYGK